MEKYECEFESTFPVRFLPIESVKLYDSNGNEVLCKCGKSATTEIFGIETCISLCNECMFCGLSESGAKITKALPDQLNFCPPYV